MRRQSLFMMIGAAFLALIAVFIARGVINAKAGSAAPAQATIAAVAAAKSLAFGDKISPDTLKLVDLPLGTVPQGAFKTIELAVGDGSRVAQRSLAVNEVIVPTAISGTGNRLSTMGVIGGAMRAVTVSVTESSGVGGLVAPGDHVDVFITRTPPEKTARFDVVVPPGDMLDAGPKRPVPAGGPETVRHGPLAIAAPSLVRQVGPEGAKPQPITDLLIQDVRVLAIGQNINVSSEKPELVKSATLEVTPAQVAKLTLGQSVGTLALALRPLSDKDHTAVASLHVEDLHDGPPHSVAAAVTHGPVRHVRRAARAASLPSIEVVRGGESTHYPVPIS